MAARKNPPRLFFQVVFYVAAYIACLIVSGVALQWLAGEFFGLTAAGLLSALAANWLSLRFFAETPGAPLNSIGLWWNRASADHLAYGLFGGMGTACLVIAPLLAAGAAHFRPIGGARFAIDGAVILTLLLAFGSAGEEIFFRGHAFQTLLARYGPRAAIIPVALVFGLLHLANPGRVWLGVANTVGFGAVFGYAFWRSRDLWLPIGLHFGWNFTLPLFGVNVSGLRIRMTGYELSWTAGSLWSGGEYGPEASVLASVAVVLLFVYLWKAPIRQQLPPVAGPPVGSILCEPPPPSLS